MFLNKTKHSIFRIDTHSNLAYLYAKTFKW